LFELTDEQWEKVKAWQIEMDAKTAKEQGRDRPYHGAIGGAYTFCFIPTSIGLITKVKHYSGEELDVTDYDSF
jgi:hypothetical protein